MSLWRTVAPIAALALGPPVHLYIRVHRERLQPQAKPLTEQAKAALAAYFSTDLLNRVRVLVADPLPLPEPPFSSLARRLGFDFPSISPIEAITFRDVIVCRTAMHRSLLFHELVHVVQFHLLGVAGFARRYVNGFLAMRSYCDIPLERSAFDLQVRYETETRPFDVAREILKDRASAS